MGSFAPDSISNVARTRSRIEIPPTRSRKNTAATSVELMMAPMSNDLSQGSPKMKRAARPTRPAVNTTPTVARVTAGSAATLKDAKRVRNPLSNRITARAKLPTEVGERRVVKLDAEPVFADEQAQAQEHQ